jgi:hypothetical protein
MRWIGVVACVLAQAVAAENEPRIRTGYLQPHDPAEKGSVLVECRHTGSDELTCEFTHIALDYLANPRELHAETAKAVAEFRKRVKSVGMKKHLESMCGGTKEEADEMRRLVEHLTAAGRLKSAQQAAELLSACDDPSEARLEQFVRQNVIWNSKTCMLSVWRQAPVRFTRTAPGKWIGSDGPRGECRERYAYTLDHHPEYKNELWTWSQTRTSVDRSSDLCKGIETGKKVEFSYRGYKPEMSCELIEFGVW